MIVALIGNQNTGKTLLFNQLTGANQHVGNFPGVTVEKKTGEIKEFKDITVVDLPGIYSLSPYTLEEIVTRDFVLKEKPDGIINIVDVTNIERNLYLTVQLLELGIPMVLAINMMDELENNGGNVNIRKLSAGLGIPVVPISALKNQGIFELITTLSKNKLPPLKVDLCQGPVHRCIHGITHLVEDHADMSGVPRRFAATKLIEGDLPMLELLSLNENEKDMIEHGITEMENQLKTDREAALADMRYSFIEQLCKVSVKKPMQTKEYVRSSKIDFFLTHKYWGIPIFLAVMIAIFWMTFDGIGGILSDWLMGTIQGSSDLIEGILERAEINPFVCDFIINGVLAGVGSVLSFLPIIMVMFFFLSLLEDSGYMARVAFFMDRPLRKLGLSGRSFVPLLIGFGCSVPAIMATRTISAEKDRKLTAMLIPFMSCSAKMPIYAVLSAAFFPENTALVMTCMYLFGILVAIICGILLDDSVFKGESAPFVMEMPNYRLPSARSVFRLMWDKAEDFLLRAFTIILAASIIIWVLQSFDFRLNVVSDVHQSMLALIGTRLGGFFAPLGFGDWMAGTALISGFTAKEAVVSTLAVLTGTSMESLPQALSAHFTRAGAISFLVFTLLYTPCVAAVAAIRREFGGMMAFGVVIFQIGVAWLASFVIFHFVNLW